MRRIARRRPRFGSPRIHDALLKRGWEGNHKRVERLWREEGMQVPRKQRKRRRLCSDNGPEFVAQEVTRWLDRAMVKTLFIAKGSPWENGYAESFN
ncbi:MAG: transposase, partial [Planctomycetes bacterium]|nr:transposase [Planctomycetota bacterium]